MVLARHEEASVNISPFWTDRRIEALREAIREGLSSTQTGLLLGCSRGAATGKAHRLGLLFRAVNEDTGKQRAIRLERRRALYAARKPAQAPFNALATSMSPNKRLPSSGHLSASEALPNSKPTPLLDLKPRQCRWPIGPSHPPGEMERTLFCGAAADPGEPYCCAHGQLAFGRKAA